MTSWGDIGGSRVIMVKNRWWSYIAPHWKAYDSGLEIPLHQNIFMLTNILRSDWGSKLMKVAFSNTGGPLTPNITSSGSFKLFWRRWIPRVISLPTSCYTTIIYFWPYWPLTPRMTSKGSFFGPTNVSNQLLVKNRPKVSNFMKIAHRPPFFNVFFA
jgi:hypothetical protein